MSFSIWFCQEQGFLHISLFSHFYFFHMMQIVYPYIRINYNDIIFCNQKLFFFQFKYIWCHNLAVEFIFIFYLIQFTVECFSSLCIDHCIDYRYNSHNDCKQIIRERTDQCQTKKADPDYHPRLQRLNSFRSQICILLLSRCFNCHIHSPFALMIS